MPTPEHKRVELYLMGADAFEALPDPHIIVDEHGWIRHINRRACAQFNIDPDTLPNQSIEKLIPGAIHQGHVSKLYEFLRNPEESPTHHEEETLVCVDGGELVNARIAVSTIHRTHTEERRIIMRIYFTDKP